MGIFLCSKVVYPQMKKQGKGKIINVSSGAFFKGLPSFMSSRHLFPPKIFTFYL